MSTNTPSTENVDYDGPEWEKGFDDGKAGRPCAPTHPKGTQLHIDYVEGWLMGDVEKDFDPDEDLGYR